MNQFHTISAVFLILAFACAPITEVHAAENTPQTVTLSAGSNTGSTLDTITANSIVTFTGTAPNVTTKLHLFPAVGGSVYLGDLEFSSDTEWSFTNSSWPLGDGVYDLKMQVGTGPTTDALLTMTVDATAPVVTLTGDTTMTVVGGTPYTDAGASATDIHDGTLTPTITSNTVNVAVGATYSVTYSATDTAGNTGTATRTVIVTEAPADTTSPTLTQVTPISSATNDSTPSYSFNSTEAGNVTYGGDCSSTTTAVLAGDTAVTFSTLADGAHTNCTITVADTAGNSGSVTVASFTVDTTGPVITLSGASTVTVTQDTAFTDPGATATDTRDGSVAVVVGGATVNTSVLGTYTITYNAEDSLHNAATEVTRMVSVVEAVRESSGGGGGSSRRKSSGSTSSGNVLGVATYRFTSELTPGMSGPDVTALQEVLIAEGLFQGSATGFYGAFTYAAVQAYQTKHGLPALGKVGPQTLALLNRESTTSSEMSEVERLQKLTELLALLQKLQELLAVAQAAGR